MTTTTPTLTFPHPILMPITGTPDTASVLILKKQLYTNARAIHTTNGGGNNGHLGLVMSNQEYVARAGIPLAPPVHPGNAPIVPAQATAAQITDINRQYDRALAAHTLYHTTTEELKKQILAAVEHRYLAALEDADFGFSDVSPCTMLNHLVTTHAQLLPDDIERNRNTLTEPWDIDTPIETLWDCITNAQRIANRANEPITDATAIRLTVTVLENTGVFDHALDKWRDKDPADQTMDNFKILFNAENKERMRKLTAKAAGYHGAN